MYRAALALAILALGITIVRFLRAPRTELRCAECAKVFPSKLWFGDDGTSSLCQECHEAAADLRWAADRGLHALRLEEVDVAPDPGERLDH